MKPGQYSISLGNPELEKRIVGAQYQQSLDSYSSFTVTVAATPQELAEWRLGKHPKEAEFVWQEHKVFRGVLSSAEARGTSQIALIFSDDLRAAAKISCDQFGKQQRLEDCLRKIADQCTLRSRFLGDFSEGLPSFPQGGSSLLGLLQALADKHGFFFATRSAGDEIVFFRPGQSLAAVSLEGAKVASFSFSQSGSESFAKLGLRYFDSKSLEGKQLQIGSQQLYSSVSAFTSDSPFQEKLQWKSAAGSLETHVTDRAHFEQGQAWLSAHFSRKVMGQEALGIVVHEPVALPGDKVKIEKTTAPALQDGTYLVASASIDIVSALPRMALTMVRP